MRGVQERVGSSLFMSTESEERISYDHPEDNREARETYLITHNGREPTHEELAQYISTGQEAKDFYKIRNSVLVG